MVDVHRYHLISESTHRVMNPFSTDKLLLVGEICEFGGTGRILDLACGKGEMLCQFTKRSRATGVGVDIYPPLLADARARALELGVADRAQFIEADAAVPLGIGQFGVVSCLGATWVGGGLGGTLEIMRSYAERRAWLLVGEVYWARPPADDLVMRYAQSFSNLAGILAVFAGAGVELVEMVLASDDDWDRYAASQWLNVANWLSANPGHPDGPDVRAERDESRRRYLADERGTLSWGVFIGRLSD